MTSKSLHIASDHRGYRLKKRLVRYIKNELKLNIEDMGPYEYIETDDYPDYAIPLAKKVVSKNGLGIVICGNGIGVNITVNKISGARCGVGYNIDVAESMKTDDDTNIIALASDHISEDYAMAIIKKWLETEFSEAERHIRRLKKIKNVEK